MKIILTVIILIAITVTLSHSRRPSNGARQGVTLKNIICSGDAMFISDINCRISAVNRTFKRLTISLNFLQDQNNLLLHLKHWVKLSTNSYGPGYYDVTIDLCDVAKNLNSDVPNVGKLFMDTSLPYWRDLYGNLLHPCPYKSPVTFNQTITGVKKEDEPIFETNIRIMQGSLKWASKVDVTFISGITKKPLISIEVFDSNY